MERGPLEGNAPYFFAAEAGIRNHTQSHTNGKGPSWGECSLFLCSGSWHTVRSITHSITLTLLSTHLSLNHTLTPGVVLDVLSPRSESWLLSWEQDVLHNVG